MNILSISFKNLSSSSKSSSCDISFALIIKLADVSGLVFSLSHQGRKSLTVSG